MVDDGAGFDSDTVKLNQGVRHMRQRAKDLGAAHDSEALKGYSVRSLDFSPRLDVSAGVKRANRSLALLV